MPRWDIPPRTDYLIDEEWEQIPGWCSIDKRDWIRSVILEGKGDSVEVGVWGGRCSLAIASALSKSTTKGRIHWAIDPYSVAAANVEHSGNGDDFQREWNNPEKYDVVRKAWLGRLVNFNLTMFVRILEIPDEQACPLFEDESLCFVHVDGNHGEVSQRETTIRWFKKLVPGGILLQDDTNIAPVIAGAVPAADKLGERVREDATHEKKWIAWRKR